ncbi:MAG: acyl-CoA dehydrogenase family protein [Panacagrimonas sp.]
MSDLTVMLRDTTRRLFGEARTKGLREFRSTLWSQVAEIGLPGLLVPEAAGGSGGQWQDALVIMEAMGEHAAALPLAETMLAARALAAAGLPVPESPIGLAVRSTGRLTENRGTWCFTGTLMGIPWGEQAKTIVGVAGDGGDSSTFVIERIAAIQVAAHRNPAGEPRIRLSFEDVPVRVLGSAEVDAHRLFEEAALLRVGQVAGALGTVLAQSVEYAGSRRQFGKPIGQFQSVQHALAVMAEETAAVKAACSGAFAAADHGAAGFEIAAAKLRANEAIGVCVALAHQVHGAIGFTHEFDLRHFTQRLMSWRTEYGNDRYWAERLGRAVAGKGALRFWDDLTGRSDAMFAPHDPA